MSYDFKNEEDVKDFIENLGTEYRFGCFSEKKPEVCHLLGDYLEAIKKDFKKASKVYKSNCDDYHYGKSCYNYGTYSFLGKGLPKANHEDAHTYFEKGCELSVSESCFNAGMMWISDQTNLKRDKDYKKGMDLLIRSCNLDNSYACYYLSGIYISGSKDNIITKDMKKAFEFSKKACDLGNIYACSNLSQMYRKGEGVIKNEEMAEKIKKKVLDLQEQQESTLQLEFGRTGKKS